MGIHFDESARLAAVTDYTPGLILALASRAAQMGDDAFSGLILAGLIVGVVGLAVAVLVGNLAKND